LDDVIAQLQIRDTNVDKLRHAVTYRFHVSRLRNIVGSRLRMKGGKSRYLKYLVNSRLHIVLRQFLMIAHS